MAYRGGTTATSTTASTIVIDLTAITGLAQNDIVLVAVFGSMNDDRTFTEPTTGTWTKDPNPDLYANDDNDSNLACFWKRMGATPDTSVTITLSGAAGSLNAVARAYSDIDTVTALDATTVTNTVVNATGSPQAPAITTNTDDATVVIFTGCTEADTVTNGPTGYGNVQNTITSIRNLMAADKVVTSAGTETPGAWSDVVLQNTDSAAHVVFALKPAGAGGVTGTVAQTLPKPTQSLTAKERITGTIAQTLAKPTQALTATATLDATGTIAQTLPKPTQAAAGTVTLSGVSGVITQTLPRLTQSLIGNVITDVAAAIAQTLPRIVQSLTGTVTNPPSDIAGGGRLWLGMRIGL